MFILEIVNKFTSHDIQSKVTKSGQDYVSLLLLAYLNNYLEPTGSYWISNMIVGVHFEVDRERIYLGRAMS